jgi:hypothetical protein
MNQGSHSALPALDAGQLIEDYRRLIKLTNPEFVPTPTKTWFDQVVI